MMLDRINDIAWQARQGSIAAIIQVLNEKLANYGVRIRAIYNNGVLQLLCEAYTEDRLEQSTLVKQIQQTLESIKPRSIRRVRINSRIVREQQLLWLDEIICKPDNQLLWSEEILLEQPNIFQQLIKNYQDNKTEAGNLNLTKAKFFKPILISSNKFKKPIWRAILPALSVCLFLIFLGGILYIVFNSKSKNILITERENSLIPKINSFKPADNKIEDSFTQAVRIANQASAAGKIANTSIQWLEIAANWQRASDLMYQVSSSHSRYQEAQIRTKLYKKYSEAAHKEADKSKF